MLYKVIYIFHKYQFQSIFLVSTSALLNAQYNENGINCLEIVKMIVKFNLYAEYRSIHEMWSSFSFIFPLPLYFSQISISKYSFEEMTIEQRLGERGGGVRLRNRKSTKHELTSLLKNANMIDC